ncbi:head-tail connector protein [Marinobacterium sp. BA1]|uniref:head-tail connector protein n=1 Tax=Marinobacterium sp. BA1 TaxID=3138931 RepID=UPI0032E763FE
MITLEDAKAHLRVQHTAEDALITALIDSAYRHAETRTGRIFDTAARTLILDGFGSTAGAIELPWTPVQSIDSVEYVDPDGVTQTLQTPPLRLETRALYPLLMPQWDTDWPATIDEPESVTITATVGMTETPADVRAGLLLLIGHLYENRESVVIGTISSELPMGVSMLLDPYRIMRVG